MYHYTDKYLLDPSLRITVALVGCGGTGSQVLSGLARMNEALEALGHGGLLVTVYDADVVTESNVGRQLFSMADVGLNKALVSVTRINRYYGLDWIAKPEHVNSAKQLKHNIVISCVDMAETRVQIAEWLQVCLSTKQSHEPDTRNYYWLDYGNLQHTGQVVLGTVGRVEQVKYDKNRNETIHTLEQRQSRAYKLPNVVELLPDIKKIKSKDTGPSCSLLQALNRQDLFINSTLANLGLALLWRLFREGRTDYQGAYLNLKTMQVNAIKVKH